MVLHDARARAEALMTQHLGSEWTFVFDRARTRAGLCNWTAHRISVSRVLAEHMSDAEFDQVVLHEIAHALAGHAAAHGPRWRQTARRIGYLGGRTHELPAARDLAIWVGTCPAGHEHGRYRRPTRAVSCSHCAPRFSRAHLISWRRRQPAA